jgi:hypothetical protein
VDSTAVIDTVERTRGNLQKIPYNDAVSLLSSAQSILARH